MTTRYHCFLKDVAEKKHDFASDTFKIALTNRAPVVATDRAFSDVSEIAAGNGYAAGGVALTLSSSAQASGVYKATFSDPGSLTSSGVIGPFRYAVVYNATAGLVVGYVDYGVAISLQNGEVLDFDLDQIAGLFTLT